MSIVVNPHNEQEEKVLLAFLDSLQYDYEAANKFGKPQTIEEYNKEIDDALAEVEAGEFIAHEDVEAYLANKRRQNVAH